MQKLESHRPAYIYLVLKVQFFFALSLFKKKTFRRVYALFICNTQKFDVISEINPTNYTNFFLVQTLVPLQ